jgi:single stranded DNA-binding protein
MDINRITLIGRVGKAPEGRDIGQNRKVELRVANNRGIGRDEEEKTNWYTVELWGPSGKFAESYVRTGDLVCVSGAHLLDSYKNKEGEMVYLNLIQNAEIQKLNRSEQESAPPQRQQNRENDRRQDRQPPRQQQTRRQDEEESDW